MNPRKRLDTPEHFNIPEVHIYDEHNRYAGKFVLKSAGDGGLGADLLAAFFKYPIVSGLGLVLLPALFIGGYLMFGETCEYELTVTTKNQGGDWASRAVWIRATSEESALATARSQYRWEAPEWPNLATTGERRGCR